MPNNLSDSSQSILPRFRIFKDLELSVYRKFILILIIFVLIFILIYAAVCTFLYFGQESLIFHPQKLDSDFNFGKLFPNSQEINIKNPDNINLNGLFLESQNTNLILPSNLSNFANQTVNSTSNLQIPQTQNLQNSKLRKDSKGLIFYLHGNSGSIAGWGNIAKFYNELGFDVLIPDYRGFGKSEGKVISQEQLFEDNQIFYNFAKSIYPENKITVIGFSIGTGMAAKITQNNKPKQLILQAPYYNLHTVMTDNFLFVPDFLLKYKLETTKYLENSQVPTTIFHGNLDETISYSNSVQIEAKLNENLKKTKNQEVSKTKLITLPNQTHMGIEENEIYQREIKKILEVVK